MIQMPNLSISIVLHNTPTNVINQCIDACCNASKLIDIFLIDNSPNDKLSYFLKDNRVSYFKSQNDGFGAGHNLAITKFKLIEKYKYHLVMNPDIKFDVDIIPKIIEYMNDNEDVGVLMPRILNSDGSLQIARRLLPSPIDIIIKRFFPRMSYNNHYEMRGIEPSNPVEIKALCGCFLFFRSVALKKVGLFDERYFMYFEDFDICRRISSKFKAIYFPLCEVTHGANREHRRRLKLFLISIQSSLKYFRKWGFVDNLRVKLNKDTLKEVNNASIPK
jgi:GT2 family glycosyltransferase